MTRIPASLAKSRTGWSIRRHAPSRTRWAGLFVLLATAGCATLGGERGQPLVSTQYQTRTGPFTIYTGFPLAPDSPAVKCLVSLENDLESKLGVRAPEVEGPVEVYILRDRETFTHFLTFHFPELPPRRAFFIAQGSKRIVYTYLNERLEEDLRHEATHAILHASVGDLPLWLDEGLAEYFEGHSGLNPEHLARLPEDLQTGWRPDLERLEQVRNVREMSPRDYRESWAWVHYFLNEAGVGRNALVGYLADVRAGLVPPESMAQRLDRHDAGADARMLAHLDRVRSRATTLHPPAAAVATRSPRTEPTVLFQNAPVESSGPTPRPTRRSMLGRFLGFLGMGGKAY